MPPIINIMDAIGIDVWAHIFCLSIADLATYRAILLASKGLNRALTAALLRPHVAAQILFNVEGPRIGYSKEFGNTAIGVDHLPHNRGSGATPIIIHEPPKNIAIDSNELSRIITGRENVYISSHSVSNNTYIPRPQDIIIGHVIMALKYDPGRPIPPTIYEDKLPALIKHGLKHMTTDNIKILTKNIAVQASPQLAHSLLRLAAQEAYHADTLSPPVSPWLGKLWALTKAFFDPTWIDQRPLMGTIAAEWLFKARPEGPVLYNIMTAQGYIAHYKSPNPILNVAHSFHLEAINWPNRGSSWASYAGQSSYIFYHLCNKYNPGIILEFSRYAYDICLREEEIDALRFSNMGRLVRVLANREAHLKGPHAHLYRVLMAAPCIVLEE